MVITSEGKWRVDRGDEVIITRDEEDGEMVGSLMDWHNVDGLVDKLPR